MEIKFIYRTKTAMYFKWQNFKQTVKAKIIYLLKAVVAFAQMTKRKVGFN